MRVPTKLHEELKALTVATLFFAVWIGMLILLKTLLLEEYHIGFTGWSKVLVGALVLSKVVLLMEHFPLGTWSRSQPAWVDTLLRTFLYSAAVAIVLILEHGFRERHQAGSVARAVTQALREAQVPHLLINTIGLAGALLAYNAFSVVRRHLGNGALTRLFLRPLPPPSSEA